jgi:hypothetical protein
MLSVPEPLANDPEDVVSALEAAEIFGKQGDVKEAVRWVRRAAEIAGDTGNDERALTLARAVADLNISASHPPQPPAEQEAQPAEQPPPPPLPAASDDPDGEAETRVVDSAKMLEDYERQLKSNGQNGAAIEAAAAPLAADAVVTAPNVPPMTASTVDTVPYGAEADLPEPPPPPPEPRAEAAPEAAAEPASDGDEPPVSRRGMSSMAELLARKEAEASSAMAAADAADADAGWGDDPPPPPPMPSTPPAQAFTTPSAQALSTPPAQALSTPPAQAVSTPPVERRTARPNADRIPTPILPTQPHTDRPPVDAPIHQAVRASVVATAEPGVFVMRLLRADQSPAPTAHEVLVVATNALASPFK